MSRPIASAMGLGLVTSLVAQGATFEKLLVFAGEDSVRISAVVKPDGVPGALKFSGRNTPVGSGNVFWEGSLGNGVAGPGVILVSNLISGLRPELWSPASP